MTKRSEVYKCSKCGNIVEVVHEGVGTLVCCDTPMAKLDEQTADMSLEKHVPMIEKTDSGLKVTVGSTLHPMTEEHFIEWIEVVADSISYKKFLKPGDEPIAEFSVSGDNIMVREFCNLHGLWKNTLE